MLGAENSTPPRYLELEAEFASTMGSQMHSFTNGKRVTKYDCVSAGMNKLTATDNAPPELQCFYAAE